MAPQIYCEPNYYLPQQFDMDARRAKFTAKVKAQELTETSNKPNLNRQTDSLIIPKFDKTSDYLREALSMAKNDKLLYRFHKFIDQPPRGIPPVQLYRDIIIEQPAEKRPMRLNGKFYDINNRLAPTPVIPDPRK